MAKKKAAKSPTDEPTFEQSLDDLEGVVAALESGELGLDEALKQYESGVASLRRCHAKLEHAERRIEVLSGFDDEGNPVAEPLDAADTPTGEESDNASRSGRRTRRPAGPKSGGVDDSQGLF